MSAMPDVLRHMNGWGFTKVEPQPHAAWLVMVGELSTPTQGSVQCEVWIDRSFERPLKVWLNKLPESTPRLVPHLGPDGYLCYAAPGTQVIDIYDPVGQIRTSLLQATEVLEQALAGKMKDDLQEEFFVYWDGIYCFHDIERRTSGSVQLLQLSDNKMYVLTDDATRSRAKFARPGRKIEEFTSQVALITSSAAPRPLQENWPPKTVSQILDWQHELMMPAGVKSGTRSSQLIATKPPAFSSSSSRKKRDTATAFLCMTFSVIVRMITVLAINAYPFSTVPSTLCRCFASMTSTWLSGIYLGVPHFLVSGSV
ncbi:E2/UBC family protein [Pseudomonas brassicae]|uniref:E2/UBC family protein n=1 Tax=Pseudomonas brassicae TaxID=2708063 RepID=UPI001FB45D43|nr:E2/UBC family protein [Pseudomonas brassicae]